MRQILIYSENENPRQALAGEIKVLNIAEEILEIGNFDEISVILGKEQITALILDNPTPEQLNQIETLDLKMPVLCLSDTEITAKNAQVFQKPIRLSVFFTNLVSLISQFEQSGESSFDMGKWKFNLITKNLIFETTEIKLTEKEAQILNYLFPKTQSVNKDTLLRDIWGYGDGITTHTLETHIYRLRQKLENTGINLVSENNEGYKLTINEII